MDILYEYFDKLKEVFYDYDLIDRFNTKYSSCIFLFATLFLVANEHLQMECWTPFHFLPSWDQYIAGFCFMEGVVIVPMNETIPADISGYKKQYYYHLVPLIFIFASFFFYLPRFFWSYIHGRTYLCFDDLITAATTFRSNSFKASLEVFGFALSLNARGPFPFKSIIPRSLILFVFDRYLILMYFLQKLFGIFNIIVMQFVMSAVLLESVDEDMFGIHYLTSLLFQTEYSKNYDFFATVGVCRFEVRQPHIVKFTPQCLHKNVKYLKFFFIFMSFYFCCLLVLSICSIFLWFKALWYRRAFLQDLIKSSSKFDEARDNAVLHQFCDFFAADGAFTLLMMNDAAAIYAARQLFFDFKWSLERTKKLS